MDNADSSPVHAKIFTGYKFATVIISVYTQTLQAETGIKMAFYNDMHNLLQQADSKDKLLILGDFNSIVGCDFELLNCRNES